MRVRQGRLRAYFGEFCFASAKTGASERKWRNSRILGLSISSSERKRIDLHPNHFWSSNISDYAECNVYTASQKVTTRLPMVRIASSAPFGRELNSVDYTNRRQQVYAVPFLDRSEYRWERKQRHFRQGSNA